RARAVRGSRSRARRRRPRRRRDALSKLARALSAPSRGSQQLGQRARRAGLLCGSASRGTRGARARESRRRALRLDRRYGRDSRARQRARRCSRAVSLSLAMSSQAPPENQTADAVLMIRPARFAANPETAGSNRFQLAAPSDRDVSARAAREFDGLAVALAAAGVRVHAFAGAREGDLPDEVFPNNWVSFHEDGTAVLYPLLAPNRRRERRKELIDALRDEHGYR